MSNRSGVFVGLVLAALAVATPGCATLGEHEKLTARVKELELERERVKATMEQDVKRMENLHALLTQAEETLRNQGANLGIRVERLEADMPKLKGDLEALQVRLERALRDVEVIKRELADKLGSTRLFLPADLPKDADGMWKAAEDRRKAGQLLEAKAIYQTFEASFPSDPRADDALMAIGGVQEQENDLTAAIKTYGAVEGRYPQGDQAPKAVLRIGELMTVQGACKRAKDIYDYLRKQYKSAPEAAQAAKRLETLGKDCKER